VGLLLLPVGIMAQEAGDLDTGFGGHGKVTTALGDSRNAYAVALEPDGKIVVAGSASSPLTRPADFALARYESGLIPRVGPPAIRFVTTGR
jgi:hypothetical protein